MPAILPELRELKKEQWLKSYSKNFSRSRACKAVKIARSTLWRWLQSDKAFATKVMEVEAGLIDEIEGKLFDLARSGNLPAIRVFLKAKAADRGYTSKVEISQYTKLEQIDTKRLELLLSNPKTADALESIAYDCLKSEKVEDSYESK